MRGDGRFSQRWSHIVNINTSVAGILGDLIIGMPSVLEITVGHWPFSDQFEHLAN